MGESACAERWWRVCVRAHVQCAGVGYGCVRAHVHSAGAVHGCVRAHVQSAGVAHRWNPMCRALVRVMGA